MGSNRKALSEYTGKKVLAAYGIHCPAEVLCQTAEEACAAAEEMGYPVALKVVSPQIQHKTEADIIRLKLGNTAAVRDAYHEISRNARAYDAAASMDGVLCQKMIEGAVAEAIIGILMDPYFGPAVVFGLGGVMVEVLKDRALGIPPLSRNEALRMIGATRGSKLLHRFRGSPPGDLEALADALIRVGRLAVDWTDRLEALDINPLLVMPEGEGVVAVDALLMLKN
jgi:acetyltransferase